MSRLLLAASEKSRLCVDVESSVLLPQNQRRELQELATSYAQEKMAFLDAVILNVTKKRKNDATMRSRQHSFRNGIGFELVFYTACSVTVHQRDDIIARLNQLAEEIEALPLPEAVA